MADYDPKQWVHQHVREMAKRSAENYVFRPTSYDPSDDRNTLREHEIEEAHKRNKNAQRYTVQDGCLALNMWTKKPILDKNGKRTGKYEDVLEQTSLCNFDARIEAERVIDDGRDEISYLLISGRLNDSSPLAQLEVLTSEFYSTMSWVSGWGGRAVLNAGGMMKDHVRAAIQYLSPEYESLTTYGHLGWRNIDSRWVFLHCGGAITAKGLDTTFKVNFADESRFRYYNLPMPCEGDALMTDVRTIIDLFLKDERICETITFPELCKAFRAPLCEVVASTCSDLLIGMTGIFKTAIAAITQAFFGAGFTPETLPMTWESTANALEKGAYRAKDVVFTIDDFKPVGDAYAVSKYHGIADRFIREHANKGGRERLRSDTSDNRRFYSRGVPVTTGEEVPRGESLRGRALIRTLNKGDINTEWLTEAQNAARDGVFARVMSAYIARLASHINELKSTDALKMAQDAERNSISNRVRSEGLSVHERTATNIAEYLIGFEQFTGFAVSTGAITREEGTALIARCREALLNVARAQAGFIHSEDESEQFLSLLRAALIGNYACLYDAGTDDAPPEKYLKACGWEEGPPRHLKRVVEGETEIETYPRFRAKGRRIGWLDYEDYKIYLNSELAYGAAEEMARRHNRNLPFDEKTMWARLADKGFIETTEEKGHKRNSTNKRICGKQQRVRVLNAEHLLGEQDALTSFGGVRW